MSFVDGKLSTVGTSLMRTIQAAFLLIIQRRALLLGNEAAASLWVHLIGRPRYKLGICVSYLILLIWTGASWLLLSIK